MTKNSLKSKKTCIYCGKPASRLRKGEHIIPESIGGALTIGELSDRAVCQSCNNGVLSDLDRELCSRSLVSIIGSQEIGSHLWQVWDVDHLSRNLLLEAEPCWINYELSSSITLPQMVFESTGPEFRGDAQTVERFGYENYQKVFLKALQKAFQKFKSGKKRKIHFERVRSDIISRDCRFPPRVFTRKSISDLAKKIENQSFILRYMTPEDKNFALRCLDSLDGRPFVNQWKKKKGSKSPAIAHFFDVNMTLRALLKFGFNLIAAYCTETAVDLSSFGEVVAQITGSKPLKPLDIAGSGFVHATDIECINSPQKAHSFRLVYLDEHWIVYSSFFGGRIGAAVSFPGPNQEKWNTIDVVAPINSKKWMCKTYSLIQPIKVNVNWKDIDKISPTLKLQESSSSLVVN